MSSRSAARALIGVCVLTCVACSGTGDSGSRPSAPSSRGVMHLGSQSGAAYAPVREAPAPGVPGARSGGMLRMVSAAPLGKLDPSVAASPAAVSILSGLLVRSLSQYVVGRDSQMEIIPDLAVHEGVPDADFTEWSYTLRTGVRFANGQLVTPQDMAFGLRLSLARPSFPGGPGSRVVVRGREIRLVLARPFPDLPYWAATPAASPRQTGSQASAPPYASLRGGATGPYMMQSMSLGRSMVLVKNPQWDPKTDAGRHQYVERFDVETGLTPARIDALMEADKGLTQSTVSLSNVRIGDAAVLPGGDAERLVKGPTPCTDVWVPDNQKIPDVRVRRALALAYPYKAVWDAKGLIAGVTVTPALNVEPPGVPGRVSFNPLPQHAPATTDASAARSMLAKAGALGFVVRFPYAGDVPEGIAVRNVLVKALHAAGFVPQPVRATSTDFDSEYVLNPAAPVNVRPATWCLRWPTGAAWIPRAFGAPSAVAAAVDPHLRLARFTRPSVSRRIHYVSTLSLDSQLTEWSRLESRVESTYLPVIATGYLRAAMMRGSSVRNAVIDPTLGTIFWKDVWLAQ